MIQGDWPSLTGSGGWGGTFPEVQAAGGKGQGDRPAQGSDLRVPGSLAPRLGSSETKPCKQLVHRATGVPQSLVHLQPGAGRGGGLELDPRVSTADGQGQRAWQGGRGILRVGLLAGVWFWSV